MTLARVVEILRGNLPGASAQQFAYAFQRAYNAAYYGLRADQELHLEYHSSAGEMIRVFSLNFDPNADAWLIDGQSSRDESLCRVFAPVSAVHLVLRMVTVEGEPERRRIGFTVTGT
jgi:hypothetical protein